jgi:MFS family permease
MRGGRSSTPVAAGSGIFYGWWVVAGSFLILLITVGTALYTPPVFLVPLQEHFGWSRAAISTAGAIAALTTGVMSPLVGVWTDRYGARMVMAGGALAMGCGFALYSAMTELWHFYAISVLAALGTACVAWLPNQALVSGWFSRKRGLAMGIALAGIGFGGLGMSPLAAALISRLGWRTTYLTLAALVLFLVVTVILAVVRNRPAELGLRPDGDPEPPGPPGEEVVSAGPGAAGLTVAESVRTRAVWVLMVANLLMIFGTMSVIGHLVALLRDAGFEGQAAATSLGLAIGVSVIGRLGFGPLADRFEKRAIMIFTGILLAAAVACLLRVGSPAAVPAFVILFGLGLGGSAVLLPLLVGECFGLLSFGAILGMIMISATVGAAIGPVLTGRIFDVTGSYQSALILHIVALVTGAFVLMFLRKPTDPGLAASRP